MARPARATIPSSPSASRSSSTTAPAGGFSECSGLQLETEVQEYPEGGLNTHVRKFPTRTKQTNMTLKRGHRRSACCGTGTPASSKGESRPRDGSIVVRDPSGERVLVEWHFPRGFPCKWIGPDLNATQNTVAVETLELCHQGLERKDMRGGAMPVHIEEMQPRSPSSDGELPLSAAQLEKLVELIAARLAERRANAQRRTAEFPAARASRRWRRGGERRWRWTRRSSRSSTRRRSIRRVG